MRLNINPEFRANWEIPTYEINLWNDKKNSYCIIIPVINEGERIKMLLYSMSELNIHLEADIIIIDGGSNDGSLDLALLKEFNVS